MQSFFKSLNFTCPICVALFNRYGYILWHLFLYVIKRQKSDGVNEIQKKFLKTGSSWQKIVPEVWILNLKKKIFEYLL